MINEYVKPSMTREERSKEIENSKKNYLKI